MTPSHRVRFEEPTSNFSKEGRRRPMFVRMVSDAKLSHHKQNLSKLSRQSSLVTPRARKRIHSDVENPAARSSSERYLSRTVSILAAVDSDDDEFSDKSQ